MDVVGPENVSHAIKQAEAASGPLSHQTGNLGLGVENQLPGASDIASARSFFSPKMDVQAIATPLSSVEHSGALAVKAASNAISPMLQIIMRLPGHLGVFNSFLECLKNLFMPHDLMTNLNGMVSGIDLTHATGLTHLGHSLPSLASQHPIDLSILPSSAHAFHTLSGEFIGTAGSAHLHMNAFDTLKQSANVSAGVDLNNPQFEGIAGTAQTSNSVSGQFSGHGESLAGPSISAQAITPKLAPAQTIFSSKFFESASSSHSSANSLLAANSQNTTTGITSGASATAAPHLVPSVNSVNTAAPTMAEHAQSSSGLSGMQAKALSLNDILHKGHMPSHSIPKHIANNPFANLASNTKLAFQSAQMDNSAITNNAYHVNAGDSHLQTAHHSNHKIFSHTESANGISNSIIAHSQASLTNHYTVKPGDSLWKISQNAFGSGEKWTQLYKLNNGVIGSNPSMIFSGQKLALSGFNANVIHPQPHVPHIEQLAHHSPSNTVAHVPEQPIHHAQATSPAAAHNPVKHANPVIAEAKVSHAPVQQAHFQGLAVEKVPDQVLTGSGGAQAATNTSAAVNKAAGQVVAGKTKSVVSFSLAPDLSFLDGQK